MNSNRSALLAALAVTFATTFAAVPARAAGADAKPAYQKDRADCEAGRTAEDRATCLKEAGAAQDERKRNRLDNAGAPATNAVDRCNALVGKDKTDCIARIDGPAKANQKVTTTGSVAGGGVLRETRTTTTGPAVVVVPASSAPKP